LKLAIAGEDARATLKRQGVSASELSRAINFDRVHFAIMAMHIKGNWAAAYFAILNRGKCAGRSIYDRCEHRSAVGAHYLRLYLEVHKNN
jgi:hypothetical protein